MMRVFRMTIPGAGRRDLLITEEKTPHTRPCCLIVDTSYSMDDHKDANLGLAKFGYDIADVLIFNEDCHRFNPTRPFAHFGGTTNYRGPFLMGTEMPPGTIFLMVTDGDDNEGQEWKSLITTLKARGCTIIPFYFGSPSSEGMWNMRYIGTEAPQFVKNFEDLVTRVRKAFNPFEEAREVAGGVVFGQFQVTSTPKPTTPAAAALTTPTPAAETKKKSSTEPLVVELNTVRDPATSMAVVSAVTAFMKTEPRTAPHVAKYLKSWLSRFTGSKKQESFGFQQVIDNIRELVATLGVAETTPGLGDLLRGAGVLSGKVPTVSEDDLAKLHEVARIAATSLPTPAVTGHARKLMKANLAVQSRMGVTEQALGGYMSTVLANQALLSFPLPTLVLETKLGDFELTSPSDPWKFGNDDDEEEEKDEEEARRQRAIAAATLNPACVAVEVTGVREMTSLQDLKTEAALLQVDTDSQDVLAALAAISFFTVTGSRQMRTWGPMAFFFTLIRQYEDATIAPTLVRSLRAYGTTTKTIREAFETLQLPTGGRQNEAAQRLAFGTSPPDAAADQMPFSMGLLALAAPLYSERFDPVQCLAPVIHEAVQALRRRGDGESPYSVFMGTTKRLVMNPLPPTAVMELLTHGWLPLDVTITIDQDTLAALVLETLTEAKAVQHPLMGLSHTVLSGAELQNFWAWLLQETSSKKKKMSTTQRDLADAATLLMVASKLVGDGKAHSSLDLATAMRDSEVQLQPDGVCHIRVSSKNPWGRSLLRGAMADMRLPKELDSLQTLSQLGVNVSAAIRSLDPFPPSCLASLEDPDAEIFNRLDWPRVTPAAAGSWSPELVGLFMQHLDSSLNHRRPDPHRQHKLFALAALVGKLQPVHFEVLDAKTTLEALRDATAQELQPDVLSDKQLEVIRDTLLRDWDTKRDPALVHRLFSQKGAVKLLRPLMARALAGPATDTSMKLAKLLRALPKAEVSDEAHQALERPELAMVPVTDEIRFMVGQWLGVYGTGSHVRLSFANLYSKLVCQEDFHGVLIRNHRSLKAAYKALAPGTTEAKAKEALEAVLKAREDKITDKVGDNESEKARKKALRKGVFPKHTLMGKVLLAMVADDHNKGMPRYV